MAKKVPTGIKYKPAKRIVKTTARYATAGEGRGVVKGARSGSLSKKDKVRYIKQVRSELGGKAAGRVKRAVNYIERGGPKNPVSTKRSVAPPRPKGVR